MLWLLKLFDMMIDPPSEVGNGLDSYDQVVNMTGLEVAEN